MKFLAFSAPNEIGCPNDHMWTVNFDNRWTTTVNFVQCLEDTTDHDAIVYDLSERVCGIMKNQVPKLSKVKMNSLCQRARGIADVSFKFVFFNQFW